MKEFFTTQRDTNYSNSVQISSIFLRKEAWAPMPLWGNLNMEIHPPPPPPTSPNHTFFRGKAKENRPMLDGSNLSG